MAGIQVVNKTNGIAEVAGQKIPAKTSVVIHKSFFKEEELKKVKNGMLIIENEKKESGKTAQDNEKKQSVAKHTNRRKK